MDRPRNFEEHRWMGDKRNQRVHDLDNAVDECGIEEILEAQTYLAFGPDTLPEARNRGYHRCHHCVSSEELSA